VALLKIIGNNKRQRKEIRSDELFFFFSISLKIKREKPRNSSGILISRRIPDIFVRMCQNKIKTFQISFPTSYFPTQEITKQSISKYENYSKVSRGKDGSAHSFVSFFTSLTFSFFAKYMDGKLHKQSTSCVEPLFLTFHPSFLFRF
jgi:hypothetical protein